MKAHDDTRNLIDQYKGMVVEEIAADMRKRAFPLHVAIENLQHDFNIGSIVRTANAFNIASVHIIGKRHWNRRGAMSTEKYLEVFHHPNYSDFVGWVKKNDLLVVGIDNVPGSVPLRDIQLVPNIVLVFGQEGPGLSKELQEICSGIAYIEQYGSTRSINVGAAAAIAMHEWVRRNVGNT